MLLLIIILAISLNVDSLGVGISYGIRNIRIPIISKVIFFVLSIFYATLAIIFGKMLMTVLPDKITNLIGVMILIFMGVWIILQSLFEENTKNNNPIYNSSVNDRSCRKTSYLKKMKCSVTKIIDEINIKNIDDSNVIGLKETLYLGTALSIDAISASIGICIAGVSSFYIPFAIGLCQIIFLSIGNMIGKKLISFTNMNKKVCFVVSGSLLIILGVIRLFA